MPGGMPGQQHEPQSSSSKSGPNIEEVDWNKRIYLD
jgi:hypothetical protein